MTSILLDTNVLIWLAHQTKLAKKHLEALAQTDNIYVSSISIMEIRIKQELGKLPRFDALAAADAMNISVLPLGGVAAQSYRLVERANSDPFDNIIIAIAIGHKLPLMTADRKILALRLPKLRCVNVRT